MKADRLTCLIIEFPNALNCLAESDRRDIDRQKN